MKLENISGIDFEKEDYESFKRICHAYDTPTNFRQKILTDYYGDLIDKASNVLEIGCGWGRNAQFFRKENHINYFAFDASSAALKFFDLLKLPKNRFFVSQTINKKILEREYDLIYSTLVLQHIGFKTSNDQIDSEDIANMLLPSLKVGGFWVSYELNVGQNNWNPDLWLYKVFENNDKYRILNRCMSPLEGSDEDGKSLHNLIIVQRVKL